jgi:hypothetical protein
VHFCTILAPDDSRVQKRTVSVRNCIIAGRIAEMVHFGTPTSPTQRS